MADVRDLEHEWKPENGEPKEYNFVLIFKRNEAQMKVGYLTADPIQQTKLLPKLNYVTWPRLKTLLNFESVVLENCLYLIGGQDTRTGKYLKQVLKFNPMKNRWTDCTPMKKRRICFCVTALDDKLFVSGGYTAENEMTDHCESYEPLINAWIEEAPLPEPLVDHVCVSWGERLLLLGGKNGDLGASDKFWILERKWSKGRGPINFWHRYTWIKKIDDMPMYMPLTLEKHMASICNNTLFVFGGIKYRREIRRDSDTLSGMKREHIERERPRPGRRNRVRGRRLHATEHAPIINIRDVDDIDQLEIIMGPGMDEPEPPVCTSTDMEAFHLDEMLTKQTGINPNTMGRMWYKCPSLLQPRCSSGTAVFGNRIYVIGGHKMESEDQCVEDVTFYHTKRRRWYKLFSLGDVDFTNVHCQVLTIPKNNKDFKAEAGALSYRWVLW